MTYKDIIAAIDEHLGKSSKQYWSDYYIGITNDIDERLHGFHQVPKKGHWWIACYADNKTIAQNVEEYYLAKGMDGDTGGGKENSTYVYCYEIDTTTKER